nr:hypothetical protein [uncultured Brevundimonas sp.]
MRRFLLPATLALAGCNAPVIDQDVVGPYRLVATDTPAEQMLCYSLSDGNCVERVPATVFEIGYDNRYIVASVDEDNDGSHLSYYYIARPLDGPLVDPSVSVKGPLSLQEFEREESRLALPKARPVG